MKIQCCNECKQSLWVHDVSPPISIHKFQRSIANCTMKVEFSHKIFALFLRYSRLNHPIGNPDSNLMVLNGAAEYSNTIRVFNRNIFEPESRNRDQKGSAVAEIFVNYCDAITLEERRATFKIFKSNLLRGMFSALGGVEGC